MGGVRAEVDAELMRGILGPGPAMLDHAFVELRLAGEWIAFDSHLVDTPLREAAQTYLRERLDQDRLKLAGFYEAVRVRYVEEDEVRRFDPGLRSFVNVNTPEDLAQAWRAGEGP